MGVPKKVKPGDAIKAKDWNDLVDYVIASTPNPGAGVRVNRGTGGTTYAATKRPGGRSSPAPDEFPFQAIVLAQPADGGDPQPPKLGVVANSHVINSTDDSTWEEDNTNWGLLSDHPQPDDAAAFDVPEIGGKIWLKCTFDSYGNLTDLSIEYGAVGDSQWDEYPDPVSINTDASPYQEFLHILIAEITDPENDPRPGIVVDVGTKDAPDKRQIVQILDTNLMLVPAITTPDAAEPNLPIAVSIAWSPPGTAADGSADPINEKSKVKTPWKFGEGIPLPDFSLYDASTTETTKLGIKNGTVANILPDGMTDGGDPPYLLDVSPGESGLVWLVVSIDDDGSGGGTGAVTNVSIDNGDSVPETEAGTAYVALGDYSVSDSGVVKIGSGATGIGSQQYLLCGDAYVFYGS